VVPRLGLTSSAAALSLLSALTYRRLLHCRLGILRANVSENTSIVAAYLCQAGDRC
jgi:hypothetical protein